VSCFAVDVFVFHFRFFTFDFSLSPLQLPVEQSLLAVAGVAPEFFDI
jgi:hypothetical protein